MRRFFLAVLVILGFATAAAFADSVPTYTLTSGSVFLTPNFSTGQSVVGYVFSGSGGIFVAGASDGPSLCVGVLAGSSCSPNSSTEPFEAGNSLGTNANGLSGITLFSIGGITITAAEPITLPNEDGPSTLTVSGPVLFSGTFGVCPLAQDGDGCAPSSSLSLANFSVNGKGIGQFQFSFVPNAVKPGIGFWNLTSATYTLSSVPEPASIILFGTGAFALLGQFLRRGKH